MTDSAQSVHDQNTQPQTSATSAGVGKEVETGGIAPGEPLPLKDIGTHEINLPKEVVSVGVSSSPTSVKLPPAVQQLGVRATGGQTPVASGQSVVLPLTDDQIAQGLKVGVTNSWRWLAEWCKRRLMQLRRITQHA